MKITYSDGSFMLSWDRVRAWYNPDGTLKDCEYKTKYRGRPATRAVPERDCNTRVYLARQGENELRNPNHARDVERAKPKDIV